jgi:site-specific DNA-methyltransferase (cytosine-N4-specific)
MKIESTTTTGSSVLPPVYSTQRGSIFCADAKDALASIPSESIALVMTSPPYALHFKKEYGNADQDEYVDWLMGFIPEIRRVLRPDGSLVLNLGGSWQKGTPTRSLCHLEAPLRIVKEGGMHLAQEFFWHNPAKLPSPAEWVTVRKIRVKDSVEYLWWFSREPFPKADNRQVLQQYSPDMERLLRRGYRPKVRPSGHVITAKFTDNGGSIPGNLLSMGNNDANSHYFAKCKQKGIAPHPARFPPQIPAFFIRFLTEEGDTVLDPFAGSCTTGEVAENLGRRWICVDREADYLEGAKLRFDEPWTEDRRRAVLGSDEPAPMTSNPLGARSQVVLPFAVGNGKPRGS